MHYHESTAPYDKHEAEKDALWDFVFTDRFNNTDWPDMIGNCQSEEIALVFKAIQRGDFLAAKVLVATLLTNYAKNEAEMAVDREGFNG